MISRHAASPPTPGFKPHRGRAPPAAARHQGKRCDLPFLPRISATPPFRQLPPHPVRPNAPPRPRPAPRQSTGDVRRGRSGRRAAEPPARPTRSPDATGSGHSIRSPPPLGDTMRTTPSANPTASQSPAGRHAWHATTPRNRRPSIDSSSDSRRDFKSSNPVLPAESDAWNSEFRNGRYSIR